MEKDEIFFWSTISFIVGIFSGSFFAPSFLLIFLSGGALALAVCLVFPKQWGLCLGLFLLVWLGGASLSLEQRESFQTMPVFTEVVQGEVRIISDPEERDFFRHVLLRFKQCHSLNCPETYVLWQAPLSFTGAAGTRLSFTCQLELPKNFSPDFDYRMFLAKEKIGYLCPKATRVVELPEDTWGKWFGLLYVPKHALEQALSQVLTEPEAGLAKGLLLGGDHYLPQALKEAFTRVGLSHMIAVSGYNITLIAEMLLTLGLFLGLWRRQAVWTALIGIVFFIVMIGMPASAARAGAMASVVFIALQSGRQARPVNGLLLAGGIMLLSNPLLLRYDLGFQLSFLATLGILWMAPYLERLAPGNVIGKKGVEILLMTLAAELFVLPIILFSFHTFSPLILVGNFLVVLVPLAMATSFFGALLFLLLPGAHLLPAWGAFGILALITYSVEWLGNIRGAGILVEGFGVTYLVLWYVLLGILISVLQKLFSRKLYGQEV